MTQTLATYPGASADDQPVSGEEPDTAQAERTELARLDRALHWIRCACPTVPVLGIQWIQVQYPVYPEQELLLAVERGDGVWLSVFEWIRTSSKQLARSIKHAVQTAWRIALTKRMLRQELTQLQQRSFDVVVKSWSVGAQPAEDGSDFYFGDLNTQLRKRNQEVLILYGDTKGDDWRAFARGQTSTDGLTRLPEICLLRPVDPIVMVMRQIWSSVRLLCLALTTPAGLSQRACLLAAQSVVGPRTTRNATYCAIGRRVGLQWRPDALISLYEGRSWERCLWTGIRSSHADCRIGGYQHTILLPGLLSLLEPQRDLVSPAVPDVVLCQGRTTRELLAFGFARLGVETIAFGSYRLLTDGGEPTPPAPDRKTVLVLPVGFLDESCRLFEFAISLASRMPDLRFILRCHPILAIEDILRLLNVSPDQLHNVDVSRDQSFGSDLSRASAVLYRGTAAALASTLSGLKPLYYGRGGMRSEDPLHSLASWRERVENEEECIEVLERYGQTSPADALLEWKSAADYVQDYAIPVDEDSYAALCRALRLDV
jgi:hypothetical protein